MLTLAFMLLDVHARLKTALRAVIRAQWNIDPPDIILNQTPRVELGELATPVAFELARQLKKAPRAIAEEIIAKTGKIDGIDKMEVAGAGYVNFHLDRASAVRGRGSRTSPPETGKVIVEHTNINPNKAAHIGHLRNAAIGDTFIRILRASGSHVEVQNYIDNTGVQVADVIVGLKQVERKSLEEVRRLAQDSSQKFDYYCWDVYARVTGYYEAEDPKYNHRAETLKLIEEGHNETAELAEIVAMTIVQCHLQTMARINVRYDLLPRESDILHLKFWDRAFQTLKDKNAIFFENEGKNAGCWVMSLETEGHEEDKIIVRSNGTVTYVGKDIAYQLWKFGLLDQDFKYEVFGQNQDLWVTASSGGRPDHPPFGRGHTVYNVIDVRQSYLQNVVKQGLLGLGFEEQAKRSIHFSYEVVALTPACAQQLGIRVSEEDSKRSHIEVSGRKGQGVKADDLLDTLEAEARKEVQSRNPELIPSETETIARQIAVGALRYFLLKFTRTAIIAFDFKEALSFDGETGPYIQYATVRANKILNKAGAVDPSFDFSKVHILLNDPLLAGFLSENDIWDLVYLALRLDEIGNQVIITQEPASFAKYAFMLAQRFNLFYHRYRVVQEEDAQRRLFYILVVDLVRESLTKALELMGIEVPRQM
jgi:arginyl-tRNA synthetase